MSTAVSGPHTVALRVGALLWVVWGLVHMLAGFIIITSDASGGFAAVADAVDPETLAMDYPAAVGGILNQHGWNLGWIGLATIIGAAFIWRANVTAIWVTAMVGGLADVGYLVFVDVPGYVKFFPGTVMTIVSGSAVVMTFWVWFSIRGRAAASNE